MALAGRWKAKMRTHKRAGDEIRTLRARYGLTLEALAKSVGCDPSSVWALEHGKAGSMELLEAVLWALGLTLADLHMQRRQIVSIQRGLHLRRSDLHLRAVA